MSKLFWRSYVGAAILYLMVMTASLFGGQIERAVAPVRTDQSITEITRSDAPHQLCWMWNSTKARNLVSPDVDTFVETATDHWVSSVYERDTLLPWGMSRAVGIGEHHQPYCVLLPAIISPAESVKVSVRIYYPGFLNLWRIPVDLPPIVSPGQPAA